MGNTVPTHIIDKNGKQTTVHKKVVDSSSNSRLSAPASHLAAQESELWNRIVKRFPGFDKYERFVRNGIKSVLEAPPEMSIEDAVQKSYPELPTIIPLSAWERIVQEVKLTHTAYEPREEVNYLERDKSDASLVWRDRYEIDAARLLAEKGKPVDVNENYYGWVNSPMNMHLTKGVGDCTIAEVGKPDDISWSEFLDTHEGSGEYVGFEADAQCACGYFRGKIRVQGEVELMRMLSEYNR